MFILFFILIIVSFLALVVGLIKPALVIRWSSKKTRGEVLLLCGIAIIVFFVLSIITAPPSSKDGQKTTKVTEKRQTVEREDKTTSQVSSPKSEDSEKTVAKEKSATKKETVTPEPEPVSYEIAWSKDISHKAMGSKSLSDFTVEELQELPVDKRIKYGIVVGKDLREEQVRPTVNKIITDLTRKDPNIDEIHLLLYSTKSRSKDAYDIAMADWSTGGDIGGITPEIARENIREGYEISITIRENLEEYLKRISRKEETKLGLSESERKEIWKELIHCEDKAMVEAEKYYDPMCSGCPAFKEENWTKLSQMEDRLIEECEENLRENYGITKDEQDKIIDEGFEKNWPTPKLPPDPECCDY